jgi:multimeric flavodoxin WrbA
MNLLIHDIKNPAEKELLKIDPNNTTVISDSEKIHPCIGCFGCWIKTPGQCIINDGYNNMGVLISKCNQLIIISRCFYGSYSPFVHNVLDRSIPYLLPYFRTKNGETHHQNRYDNTVAFAAYFYGKISGREKETVRKLVAANGVNLFAQKTEIYFYNTIEDLPEAL